MRPHYVFRNRWRWLLGAFAMALPTLAGCKGDDGPQGPAGLRGPPGTVLPEPGDGLVLTIESVEVGADRRPVAIFRLEDGDGAPMALASLDGDPRFVIGHLEIDATSGLTRLRSDVVNEVEGRSYTRNGTMMAPALASAEQAGTDSGGEITVVGDGEYRYSFGTQLPDSYDESATHVVAVFASRLGRSLVANDVHRFVPAGGEPSTHEVVTNDACNECHGTISAHSGVRRAVGLCAVCHTDQTVDPETGESLELSHMIHKIHAGSTLSEPYFIVGFNQSVHDYSHVVYPGQLLSCEKCHKGADGDRWRTAPSRGACSGCHDDVNFETGENHAEGLQQFDDSLCNRCHREEMALEFDRTVPGAHVIPYESSANPHLELAIIGVENMTPGAQPSIRFTVDDDSGPVDITTLDRVALLFAGSTNDYSQAIARNTVTVHGSGAAGTLVENAAGDYTFTPNAYTLPADAAGTWSVGMEGRTMAIDVNGSSIRFGATNPVVHIDTADGTLGGGDPEPRRQIVDEAKCNACHHDILFHGNLRTDTRYCVLCHNTRATDEPRRPGVDAETNPPASIDFDLLIHRIHRGEDLTGDYTVYGFGNTPHEWSHVVFPNDIANCSVCHVSDSHLLPLPASSQATVVELAGVPVPADGAIRPPTTGACTGCHNDPATLTHARLESFVDGPDDWSEACSVCHGEGSSLAVSLIHDR